MAEVTRVPLQPIAKGSLTKLWLGIAVVIAIAAAVAWASVPVGVSVRTLQAGSGEFATPEDVVFAKYVGTLEDGTVFDQSPDQQQLPPEIAGMIPEGTPLPLGQMIPGFQEAAVQMQEGGEYIAQIPAKLAYGEEGSMNPQTGEGVPPGADLTFEIEITEIMSQEEFQQLAQAVQMRMMQAQQQQPGAGAMPPPGAQPMP